MIKNTKTILTAIAITAIASLFGASSYLSMSTPALAVTQPVSEGPNEDGETNDDDGSTNQQTTVIIGSVNVGDTIKNYIDTHQKVSFVEAATTAEKQVQNGSIVEGDLDVKQGYLVYTFSVIDTQNNISYHVIIDAGDGKVLNKSDGMPYEQHGMHEFGEH